jgi:formylmethanofuran dehydrogenase subunit E
MISAKVRAMVSTYRGQPLVYSNQCCRCGECESPEDTKHWPRDDDGDLVCPTCAEKEGIEE